MEMGTPIINGRNGRTAKLLLAAACLMLLTTFQTSTNASEQQDTDGESLKLAAKLVQQLGARRFEEREEASRKLGELGGPALIALRQAAKSSDPELRLRAQELLPKIEAEAGSWEAKIRQKEAAGRFNIPVEKELDLGEKLKLKLVLIPDGHFQMGRECSDGRTMPLRPIKFTKPFYMGKLQVTQAQYQEIMENNPSEEVGEDLPVEHIGWNNARAFCGKVSDMTGLEVRLPTEAEWEYACRAGTQTLYYNGETEDALDKAAWYRENSGGVPHPVGRKEPNGFGLHDMLGNVWEMCEDDWHFGYNGAPKDARAWIDEPRAPSRVIRGGTSTLGAALTTSFHRSGCSAIESSYFAGFRVVVPISTEKETPAPPSDIAE